MTTKQRLDRILQLIESREISKQEELTQLLNEEGYNVSQATVSRDINKLNIIKVEGLHKKFKFVQAKNTANEIPENIINLFKQITVSINSANNLVVVKTLSGNGSSVGMAIDAMHFPQVLGSVAGDDTLLIITKTNQDAEILIKSLKMI